jgi:hypothetical protein
VHQPRRFYPLSRTGFDTENGTETQAIALAYDLVVFAAPTKSAAHDQYAR